MSATEEPQSFRRLEYPYNGQLDLVSHPLSLLTSDIKSTEIIVNVKAASFNPVDLILYNSHKYLFFKRGSKGIGRDFAGIVTHAGSDVTKFKVGDKVSGIFEPIYTDQGSFTEYLKLDTATHKDVGKFPEKLSFEEASSFNLTFGTAHTLLSHHKPPTKNTKVLILGGGTSVAWYLIQLLKEHYEVQFVASVNSPKSSQRVLSIGVDAIIDYTKGDVSKQVLATVAANNNEKYDLVLDTVGNKELFPIMNQVLKPKEEDSGYVTIVGDQVADYNGSALGFFSFGMISKVFRSQPFNYNFSGITAGAWYDLAAEMFEQGKLMPLIDSVHTLSSWKSGYDRIKDHKAEGKVVLKTDE